MSDKGKRIHIRLTDDLRERLEAVRELMRVRLWSGTLTHPTMTDVIILALEELADMAEAGDELIRGPRTILRRNPSQWLPTDGHDGGHWYVKPLCSWSAYLNTGRGIGLDENDRRCLDADAARYCPGLQVEARGTVFSGHALPAKGEVVGVDGLNIRVRGEDGEIVTAHAYDLAPVIEPPAERPNLGKGKR